MEKKTTSPSKTAGKPIICKAAVCRAPGEPLVIEEIEVAPPKAWEVRIKILCSSLCHTDVTFWKLDAGPLAVFPRIFGHEAVGVVESVGEHVEEVKEGDIVLPTFQLNCRECRNCRSKRTNICSKYGDASLHIMARDGTTRFRDAKGEIINHFIFVSSFSEYTVVDILQVIKINEEIPVEKACLFSCGVTTGVGSAWNVADVEEGASVVVFGLGAVGLAVAEGARARGASKIIGVDINPAKFEIGKKFGITEFINPTTCGDKRVSQVIKELTDGGADYCFECVGTTSLLEEAFESSREGSRTVMVGVEMSFNPMKLCGIDLIKGRSVMGGLFGGMQAKTDVPVLLQKYLNKELHLDGLITHEVSFKDINKAFDYLLRGESIRCIIWMDK